MKLEEASIRSGVHAETLKGWRRKGYLGPVPANGTGNPADYTEVAVSKARTLRSASVLGLPIALLAKRLPDDLHSYSPGSFFIGVRAREDEVDCALFRADEVDVCDGTAVAFIPLQRAYPR